MNIEEKEEVSFDLVLREAEEMDKQELFRPEVVEKILDTIKDKVKEFEPDLTTAKGRKEIAYIANKVARSKTFLDGIGKNVVSEWKAKAKDVDDQRKHIRDTLDAMKEYVRKPLTEWENEEKERQEKINNRILEIKAYSDLAMYENLTAIEIKEKLEDVNAIEIDDSFGDNKTTAQNEKENSISALEKLITDKAKHEKEQAELAELRKEKEEREKKEAEEKAEAERKAQEEKIRKEAEEKAKIEAEQKAKEAIAKVEAEKQEILRKQEEEKANADAAQKQKEEEERKRIANESHRSSIEDQAIVSLVNSCGDFVNIRISKEVIKAISENKIKNVSINY
jgi:hypothetical protein